jgi:hypothetical protein
MRNIICCFVFALLLGACAPSQEVIQEAVEGTLSVILTSTSEKAATLEHISSATATDPPIASATERVRPTYPPTRTLRPTPAITITRRPRPSSTPRPTATSLSTQDLIATFEAFIISDHGPGYYLVNVDIAPGIWRSSSDLDSCYWARLDRTGDIIDNYFGFGGSTIYIAPTDFAVELATDCGIWTYLSPP